MLISLSGGIPCFRHCKSEIISSSEQRCPCPAPAEDAAGLPLPQLQCGCGPA